MLGRKRWTEKEMFYLYQYPSISKNELAKILNRSVNSITSKIQELNLSEDYGNAELELSVEQFCEDCINSPESCSLSPELCLEDSDAKLYKKFYNIILEKNQPEQVIQIKKRKRNSTQRLRLVE